MSIRVTSEQMAPNLTALCNELRSEESFHCGSLCINLGRIKLLAPGPLIIICINEQGSLTKRTRAAHAIRKPLLHARKVNHVRARQFDSMPLVFLKGDKADWAFHHCPGGLLACESRQSIQCSQDLRTILDCIYALRCRLWRLLAKAAREPSRKAIAQNSKCDHSQDHNAKCANIGDHGDDVKQCRLYIP